MTEKKTATAKKTKSKKLAKPRTIKPTVEDLASLLGGS